MIEFVKRMLKVKFVEGVVWALLAFVVVYIIVDQSLRGGAGG